MKDNKTAIIKYKGNNLSKLGRPTKYSLKMVKKAQKYLKKCMIEDSLPTIEDLALALRIATRSIYTWAEIHFEFSQTIDQIQEVQRSMLIKKGLKGEYSASIVIFLLKAIHNFRDDVRPYNATQNNINNWNLSPELLQEALNFKVKD